MAIGYGEQIDRSLKTLFPKGSVVRLKKTVKKCHNKKLRSLGKSLMDDAPKRRSIYSGWAS